MSLDERLSALIRRIYCAAHDAEQWDRVAREVLGSVGAHAGLTTLVDLKNREYNALRFYGPESSRIETALAEYQQIYATDPSLSWAARNPAARFCDSSRTVAAGEYLTHPFIKWNRDRLGSTHWYVGYTPPEDQFSYSLSVHFPAEQGPGSAQSLRLFRMLFDHLDCAMRLSRRPFNTDSSRSLFMLDSAGNVRELSRGAQQLLTAVDGFTVVEGRLTAALPCEQSALDAGLGRSHQ